MNCPCGNGQLRVTHTTTGDASIRRRRRCTACGRVEATVERFSDQDGARLRKVREQVAQIEANVTTDIAGVRVWLDGLIGLAENEG